LQVASAPAGSDDGEAALAPLLGDCFVVLAQLFAAMQFIGELCACNLPAMTICVAVADISMYCQAQASTQTQAHKPTRQIGGNINHLAAVEEKFLKGYRVPALLAVGLEASDPSY
jgi:hypothetical protein